MTDQPTTDSLVSNGSDSGTAASEGVHRLQVRLVMGGHTSGGTAASEGGTVLFSGCSKKHSIVFLPPPQEHQTLFVVWVGDSFGGGLGKKYSTQLTKSKYVQYRKKVIVCTYIHT